MFKKYTRSMAAARQGLRGQVRLRVAFLGRAPKAIALSRGARRQDMGRCAKIGLSFAPHISGEHMWRAVREGTECVVGMRVGT